MRYNFFAEQNMMYAFECQPLKIKLFKFGHKKTAMIYSNAYQVNQLYLMHAYKNCVKKYKYTVREGNKIILAFVKYSPIVYHKIMYSKNQLNTLSDLTHSNKILIQNTNKNDRLSYKC